MARTRLPLALLLAVALLPLACSSALHAVGASPDLARLEAESLVWFQHYAAADADAMADLYAMDALIMPPNAAPVSGRKAICEFLGADAAGSRAAGIRLRNRAVTGSGIDGDTGWISGSYDVLDAGGAVLDSGSYLSVHRRIDGRWLYIRDTWNSERPLAH